MIFTYRDNKRAFFNPIIKQYMGLLIVEIESFDISGADGIFEQMIGGGCKMAKLPHISVTIN